MDKQSHSPLQVKEKYYIAYHACITGLFRHQGGFRNVGIEEMQVDKRM